MEFAVVRTGTTHRLEGLGPFTDVVNDFFSHLETRGFAAGTVRGYAYDLLNFGRFLAERKATLTDVVATDVFDYLDWQAKPKPTGGAKVVRLSDRRGPAPATMNRRIAAVRGLFEYAVMTGVRDDNPVPAARRSTPLHGASEQGAGRAGPRRRASRAKRGAAGAPGSSAAREP